MKSVLSMFLLAIAFHAKANIAFDTAPSFESPGQYRVGFRTVTLDDPWRRNNLLLNMKDPPLQRRVLVNIWYPTLDEGRMIHADYLRGKEAYEKIYLQAYDRFRRIFFYQESFSKTAFAYRTPLPQNAIPPQPEAFQRAIEGARDAKPAPGKFPIIFYHAGAQGGFEENAPLLEHLARHGYFGVAVIGPASQGEIDATLRSDEMMWNDLSLALENLKLDSSVDPSRIALMGFSAGAQATLEFLMKQGHFQAAILLDSTMVNQDFANYKSRILDDVRSEGFRVETPLLILSEIGAEYKKAKRFRLYESMTRAPRIMVDFGREVPHEDFIWHGMITRSWQPDADKADFNRAMQRYSFIGGLSLKFLDEAFSVRPNWSRLEESFQKAPPIPIYWEMDLGRRPTLSVQDLSRMLQDDPESFQMKIKAALANKTMDAKDLSSLISHIRYTDSSLKALMICDALEPDAMDDALGCAAIALENNRIDKAESYVKTYYRLNKKPAKAASGWEHDSYADGRRLLDLIKILRSESGRKKL